MAKTEYINLIGLAEYVPFVHNLQESVTLAVEFEKRLRTTTDGLTELKKYCNIDDSFRVAVNKDFNDMVIQMYGTSILVQCWMKLNIFDSDNKLISKGETFYFEVDTGKITVMDLIVEEIQI